MNNDPNLFIYRPLSEESAEMVRSLQQSYRSISSFSPIADPHLTLLSGQIADDTSFETLVTRIKKGPETSEDSLDLSIANSFIHKSTRRAGQAAIGMLLKGDLLETVLDEHEYLTAKGERFCSSIKQRKLRPHVTIGYLNKVQAINPIMRPVKDCVEMPVSLLPIKSNISQIYAFKPIHTKKDKITNIEVAKVLPETEREVIQIRSIKPGSIPSGLLSTLRTAIE